MIIQKLQDQEQKVFTMPLGSYGLFVRLYTSFLEFRIF